VPLSVSFFLLLRQVSQATKTKIQILWSISKQFIITCKRLKMKRINGYFYGRFFVEKLLKRIEVMFFCCWILTSILAAIYAAEIERPLRSCGLRFMNDTPCGL
jgi:hypothetical protein